MKFQKLKNQLRKGIFLSSMMGITDGKFCAQRGEGCHMVQIGAYLAEPPKYGTEKWFLPPNPADCIKFFRNELEHLKTLDVVNCLNLATPNLDWGLDAATCFHNAGGDIVELNVHGSYRPYLEQGKLKAMVLPENRTELFEWIEAFSKLEIPLIVKFRAGYIENYSPILEKIKRYNIFGIHFNVGIEENRKPDFEFVEKCTRNSYLLLISGCLRTRKDVKMMFDAGADVVGLARPTRDNASFIQHLKGK